MAYEQTRDDWPKANSLEMDQAIQEALRYRRRRIISFAKDITEILVSNDFLTHEESIPRRAFDLAESFYNEADRRFGTPMENYE